MSGFNLPPGCSVNDIPGNGPFFCEVCAAHTDTDCVCPECPECGAFGDPACYEKHGLTRSDLQKERLAHFAAQHKADLAAEQAFYEKHGHDI